MKTETKIVIGAILLAILLWIGDGLLDSLFFSEATLVESLFTKVSLFEFYLRSFGMAFILIFGVIMAKVFERHRQLEEALANSEENFRNSIDDSPLAILITKGRGEVAYVNQAALDIFGYAIIEDFFNIPYTKRYSPEHQKVLQELWEKRENGEFVPEFIEHEIIRTDGKRRHVETFTKKISWNGEKAVQVIFTDVTERKQAEQALKISEQNYRNTLESQNLGHRVYDHQGNLLYSNPAIARIYGYDSVKELAATTKDQRLTPKSYAESLERIKRAIEGEKLPSQYEIEIIRQDGQVRYLEAHPNLVQWDGKTRTQIIYQDVTDRKQMEEQLRHAQILGVLGEMTAGIAHEVGNPLASIVLFSETAMKGVNDPRQTKKDLKVIHDEAQRAGKLMRDLLAYSRKMEPDMGRINVHIVIEKVASMLSYRLNVMSVQLTVNLQQAPVYIQGDTAQLTQVFMNIILNAEEAMRETSKGSIEISDKIENGRVLVSIADDGSGIPDENLDKIFLPFFTTKDVGKGTGLGLSMSYGIISGHGGSITARNNEAGGATFTLEFPLYSE